MLVALGGLAITARAARAVAGTDTAEVNCTLVVPADPLSAQGLATPYRLLKPCHEADLGSAAFVEATVLDPASGQISVYAPLVLDEGLAPAAPPILPRLPAGAVVGLWFGFNGDNLTLRGASGSTGGSGTSGGGSGSTSSGGGSPAQGDCVNGSRNSAFGQFAYCNAAAFFAAANAAITAGTLVVPPLGTGADGRTCPTTRDFALVDADPSDNVTSTYLVLGDGSTAQNTAPNRAALAGRGARVQVNGSDNGLLAAHLDPALGCEPYRAPDLADVGTESTSLALNEIQAAAHQAAPVALVPLSDPMTQLGGRASVAKTDLYRVGVDQPPVDPATDTPSEYCRNLVTVGLSRTRLDRALTRQAASPDPAAANSLFTFLAQRLHGAFDALACAALLGLRNPVSVVTDDRGVAIDARFAVVSPSAAGASTARPAGSGSRSQPAPGGSGSRSAPGGSGSRSAPGGSRSRPAASSASQSQAVTGPAAPPPSSAVASPSVDYGVRASSEADAAGAQPPATSADAAGAQSAAPRQQPAFTASGNRPAPTWPASRPAAGAAQPPVPLDTSRGMPARSGAAAPAIPTAPMRLRNPDLAAGATGRSPLDGTLGPILVVAGVVIALGALVQVARARFRRY